MTIAKTVYATPEMASMQEQLANKAGQKKSFLPQQDGILVLRKPSGPTSARCLTAIKRLGQKKIGHAGTLDPMAAGVLLVLLGQATKLSGYLQSGGEKIYSGSIRLGQTTDTWDSQGTILSEKPWQDIREADIRQGIAAWKKLAEQPVPAYSAAKHQGQPLYKMARKGMDVPKKIKSIQISQADTLGVSLPFVQFRVTCSSGTYIRSLAHSLGMRLGCGAVLTELTREYSHPFGLDVAHDPADFISDPALLLQCIRPITEALPEWPQVDLTRDEAIRVRNGMPVPCRSGDAHTMASSMALLLEEGQALALAQRKSTAQGTCWAVLRGLWNQP